VDFDDFLAARLGPLLRYATVVTCDPPLDRDRLEALAPPGHDHVAVQELHVAVQELHAVAR
jgi:hypothetical protein